VRREREALIFSGCNSHPVTGSLQPVGLWRIKATRTRKTRNADACHRRRGRGTTAIRGHTSVVAWNGHCSEKQRNAAGSGLTRLAGTKIGDCWTRHVRERWKDSLSGATRSWSTTRAGYSAGARRRYCASWRRFSIAWARLPKAGGHGSQSSVRAGCLGASSRRPATGCRRSPTDWACAASSIWGDVRHVEISSRLKTGRDRRSPARQFPVESALMRRTRPGHHLSGTQAPRPDRALGPGNPSRPPLAGFGCGNESHLASCSAMARVAGYILHLRPSLSPAILHVVHLQEADQ
jgi:hypothetical protein